MQRYFECKIRYEKQITDTNDKDCGKVKKITETYLVDALSYTEAEARIVKEMAQYIKGEYSITGIKQAKYAEIFYKEDDLCENWYACKIRITLIDESRGAEKKVPQSLLVRAEGVDDAWKRLMEGMKSTMSDFEITAIGLSPILDYFRYTPDAEITRKIELTD
ncbi:MAG: DUF4494 domain-containing protein [Paludibacteraceae bacterium]|jgi:hypothetical protein|nr:DUF4494 domain-containing protein [Paludibacteraceae bacterium]HPG55757.1 DUF4494 domain-containing protein [Candidatus Enterocola sp.]